MPRKINILVFSLSVIFALNLASAAAIQLTGDTSEPRHSLFLLGQSLTLHFTITGVPAANDKQLLVDIEDEQAKSLQTYAIPLAAAQSDDWSAKFIDAGEPATHHWLVDISPRHDRLGFFQAKARLSSGELLAGCCSRPPGFLTYAIIPAPSQRQSYPPRETFFGMMGAFEPALLGQGWQVHNYSMFCWRAFEPDDPSQFDGKVQEYEAAEASGSWVAMPHFAGQHHFNLAGKHGSIASYSVLPIGQPPYWAARNETRTHNAAALTKEGETAFRQFCLKLGRYLAEKRADQEVHYYQITAEPEIPWGYKGSNEELVRIYEIAYAALHEVDPKAVVAGPAFGLDAIEQLEEMLRLGLANHLDVLDFHPYMGGDVLPSEFKLVSKIRDIRELVQKHAGRQLPLTGTEAGYDAAGENTEKWLRMAWSDVQHNLILLGEGFWFNVSFHGADNSREMYQNTWGHFFNLDPKRDYGIQKASPKPVVPAYAAMSWLLEGHQSAGAIEWLGDGVNAYAYERGQSVILALWSDWPQTVRIPLAKDTAQHYDWMGNAQQLDCPDGMLQLQLKQEPQYIVGVDPEHWGKNGRGKQLLVQESRLRAAPGNVITLHCQVRGMANKSFTGELHAQPVTPLGLAGESRSVNCRAGQTQEVAFTWRLPTDAAIGEHQLAFLLLSNGVPCAGAGTTVLVEPKLQITRITPLCNNDQIGLAFTLQTAETADFAGVLQVHPSTGELPPRQTSLTTARGSSVKTQFFWPFPTPAPWHLAVTAAATDTAGHKTTVTNAEFSFCAATRMAKAPVIDGDLQDWQAIEALTLGKPQLVDGAEHWRGDSDFAAAVKFAWDQQALYLACAVRDDQHYQMAAKMPFYSWDDSLQLAINLDPHNANLAGGHRVEGGILKRWQEFIFALDSTSPDKAPTAIRMSSYDLRFAPAGNMTSEQLPVAISRNGDITTYEMALPWQTLGMEKTPAPGTALGVALMLRDLDLVAGERQAKTMQLFGGLFPTREINKYGWLKLGLPNNALSHRPNTQAPQVPQVP